MLFGLCALAGLVVVVTLVDVVYQLAHNAQPAISRFGLGFLWHTAWKPNFNIEGAGALIYGTVVSSLIALVLATPLGIAIGLYLSMMAPRRVRAIVGSAGRDARGGPEHHLRLLGTGRARPVHRQPRARTAQRARVHPAVRAGAATIGISMLSAGIVLTVMILPIISALSRDLFLTVPQELKDGAAALGATQWEIIRGIVLPSTASGVGAAVVLGLGRALGEAIAVSFVIGDVSRSTPRCSSPGRAIAERIANQFPGALNTLHTAVDVLRGADPRGDRDADEHRGAGDRQPVRRQLGDRVRV